MTCFPQGPDRRTELGGRGPLTHAPGGSAKGGTPVGAELRVAGLVCILPGDRATWGAQGSLPGWKGCVLPWGW